MGLLGYSYSKYKLSSVEYDIRFSTIDARWGIPNVIRHQSIVNGYRSFTMISRDYAMFIVNCNLMKYGDPRSIIANFLDARQQTVKFMPHADYGVYLTELGGVEADFYVESVIPYYLENEPPMLEDKVQMVFKSIKGVQFPEALKAYLVDGSGGYFVDTEGDKLERTD